MKKLLLVTLSILSLSSFAQTKINGAGATFPHAIYSKWFSEYSKAHPAVQFDYQAIGSGGGIRQLVNETVDFGASDAVMTDKDKKDAKFEILHIPTVMGAVAISYNVSGVANGLKLDGATLANIFLGNITHWNDAAIAKLNPGLTLPKTEILVVRRADGSGTTSIFSEYLSAVSPEWSSKVGQGKSLNWPTGIGAKGNDGVTALVKQTDGAIGYIDLAHALKNNLSISAMKNSNNEFIIPNVDTVSLSANGMNKASKSFTDSIVNSNAKGAYPISAFTYILLSLGKKDNKQVEIHKFLKWALTDGQTYAPSLFYSPLPKSLSKNVLERINKL